MTDRLRGYGRALLALWLGSLGCVGCLGGTVWLPDAGDDVDAVLARTPSPAPAHGSSRTFLVRAVALLRLGQLNQAADAVDRALLREPTDPAANIIAARIRTAQGAVEQALGHYERVLDNGRSLGASVSRERTVLLIRQAENALSQHRPSAALRYLERLRKSTSQLGPRTASEVDGLALDVAEMLLDAGRIRLAEQVLAETSHGVGRGDARWTLLRLRARLIGGDDDGAEAALWAWAADRLDRQVEVAEALMDLGRYEGAVTALRERIQEPVKDPRVWSIVVTAAEELGNYGLLASGTVSMARSISADDHAAYVLLEGANRLLFADRHALAIPLIGEAVRRASDPVQVFRLLVETARQIADGPGSPEDSVPLDRQVSSVALELLQSSGVLQVEVLRALDLGSASPRSQGSRVLEQVLFDPVLSSTEFADIVERVHVISPSRAKAAATRLMAGPGNPEEGSLDRARVLRLAGFLEQSRTLALALVKDPHHGAGACRLLGMLAQAGVQGNGVPAYGWFKDAIRRSPNPDDLAVELAGSALAAGEPGLAESLLPPTSPPGIAGTAWLRTRTLLDLKKGPLEPVRVRAYLGPLLALDDQPARTMTLHWLLARVLGVFPLAGVKNELMEALVRIQSADPALRQRVAKDRLNRGDVTGALKLWSHQNMDDLWPGGAQVALARQLIASDHAEKGVQLLLKLPLGAVGIPELHVRLAQHCLKTARPLWARAHVEHLLTHHRPWVGNNRNEIQALARHLIAAGEGDSAVACWEPLLERRPKDPQLLIGLGEALLVASRGDAARETFTNALHWSRRKDRLVVQISRIYANSGDLVSAMEFIRPWAPKGTTETFNQAVILHRSAGDFQGLKTLAVQRSRFLLSGRKSSRRRALRDLVNLTNQLEQAGEQTVARQILSEAVVTHPQNKALREAATKNALRGGLSTLGLDHIKRGLSLASAGDHAWAEAVRWLLDRGYVTEAASLVEDAEPSTRTDPQMLFVRGRLALAQGSREEAERLFADGLRGAGEPDEYLVALSALLQASGHPHLLRRLHEGAPVAVSQSPRHALRLARLYLTEGLVDDAGRLFASFLARGEGGALEVARAFVEEDALDQAITTYRDALEQHGHRGEGFPLPELAVTLIEAGRPDAVPGVITRYLSRQESPAAAALQVFNTYKALGDLPNALLWLGRADELQPRADHDRTKGELLLSAGDLPGAQAAFRSYLQREAMVLLGKVGIRQRRRSRPSKGVPVRLVHAATQVVKSYERRALYEEGRSFVAAAVRAFGDASWFCVTEARLSILAGDIEGGLRRLHGAPALVSRASKNEMILLMDALEGRQRTVASSRILRQMLDESWDTDLALIRLRHLLLQGREDAARVQATELAVITGVEGRIRAAHLAVLVGHPHLAAELMEAVQSIPGGASGVLAHQVRSYLQRLELIPPTEQSASSFEPPASALVSDGPPGEAAPAFLEALRRERGMGIMARRALVEAAAYGDSELYEEMVGLVVGWSDIPAAEERWDTIAGWLNASHYSCEAARSLESGLQLNRARPDRVLALLSAARSCGDHAQAERVLQWALELWRGESKTLLRFVDRLLDHEHLSQAHQILQGLPERRGLPGQQRALLLARWTLRSDRPSAEVVERLKDVLAAAPVRSGGREAVWRLLLQEERPDLAFEVPDLVPVVTTLTPSSHSLAARLAWETGRLPLARELYGARLVTGSREALRAGLEALRSALLAGDSEGAASLITGLVTRSGAERASHETLFRVVRTLEELEESPEPGLLDLASEEVTRAVSTLSDDSPQRVTVAAILREIRGDREGSLRVYESAAARYPQQLVHVNNFAYAMVCDDVNIPLALRLAQRAVLASMEPVPSTLDTLAWAFFRSGRVTDARKAMASALHHWGLSGREGPVDSPEVLLHLAMIQRASGDHEAAAVTLDLCATGWNRGEHRNRCRVLRAQSPSQSPP